MHTTTSTLTNRENNSYILDLSLALLALVFLLSSHPAYAIDIEFLHCERTPVGFEAEVLPWSINDAAGNDVKWETCSAADNITGESGKSLCVTPSGINFDTTVDTNDFNLKGATSAMLKFTLNYQDAQLFKDRFAVEVRVGAGAWNPLMSEEINDWGLPAGPGVPIQLPLNAYLGMDDVQVRFRYHDQSNTGVGNTIHIDEVRLECLGGADLSTTMTPSSSTVIEGDTIDIDYILKNNGPSSATDVVNINYLSEASTILGITGLPLTSMDDIKVSQFAYSLALPLANGSAIDSVSANVRMAMYPETAFEVTTPNAIAGIYDSVGSLFGPAIPSGSKLTGTIVLAVDGLGGSHFDGCDPLTNGADVSGKIVLLHNVLCDADVAVKNAQDAGAVAAIVGKQSGGPLKDVLYPSTSLPPLTPSGSVIAPITIPSLRISQATSDILKLNIASSVGVQIQPVEVLAQEHGIITFSLGEEFDPDFGVFDFILGLFNGSSTNIDIKTVTVLRDLDKDGTADINESCPADPAKTSPGGCGCGVADTDDNGNGTLDCQESPAPSGDSDAVKALKLSASHLLDAIQKLKPLKDGQSKNKRKKATAQKKLVKQLLAALLADVNTHGASVVLTSSSANITDLTDSARRKVKKALRLKSKKFKKNKSRAKKSVSDFQSALG